MMRNAVRDLDAAARARLPSSRRPSLSSRWSSTSHARPKESSPRAAWSVPRSIASPTTSSTTPRATARERSARRRRELHLGTAARRPRRAPRERSECAFRDHRERTCPTREWTSHSLAAPERPNAIAPPMKSVGTANDEPAASGAPGCAGDATERQYCANPQSANGARTAHASPSNAQIGSWAVTRVSEPLSAKCSHVKLKKPPAPRSLVRLRRKRRPRSSSPGAYSVLSTSPALDALVCSCKPFSSASRVRRFDQKVM